MFLAIAQCTRGYPRHCIVWVGSLLEGVSFTTHMRGGVVLKKVFFKIWLASKKNVIPLVVGGMLFFFQLSLCKEIW